MNSIFKFIIVSYCTVFAGQSRLIAQNLLDIQNWLPGQGSINIFNVNGINAENIREWGNGPDGKRAVLWKAVPDGNSDADGGWNTQPITINPETMYRFTVWIKKTNSADGISYFGCSNVTELTGEANSNPYFWYGNLPELNRWYLLVGYIHSSNDGTTANYGGIYDGQTGIKVVECKDYKFISGVNSTYHRTYLYYDPNVNDRQYFYAPRIEQINGNESSIPALLGIQSASSDQTFFSGNVGVGIINPQNRLDVNGTIHSQEVKVDMDGWSDFVFKKEYQLPTLEEVEKHIVEKGHLENIPNEEEVLKNGINLGEMNAKLLQKIEEITLYMIEMKKENTEIRKENIEIKKRIEKIEKK